MGLFSRRRHAETQTGTPPAAQPEPAAQAQPAAAVVKLGLDPDSGLDSASELAGARTPLQRITQQIAPFLGPDGAFSVPLALSLEAFFEGNEAVGSICCNLDVTPADVYATLRAIRARTGVEDVLVLLKEVEQDEDGQQDWPFAEDVLVITAADASAVASWFPDDQAPDEVVPSPVSAGTAQTWNCWWD